MEIFYYCFDKLENINPKQIISIIVIQISTLCTCKWLCHIAYRKIMHKFENWEYLHSTMAGKSKYKQLHVTLEYVI